MKRIRAEIEINASAERVWHILTDFAAFPQWNPFIRQISGELTVGGKLDVFLQ
ncbi:MAG: SRPBCC family protein, partial [Halobacteriota archaeon]